MAPPLSPPKAAPHDFYADHPTSSCNLIIGDKTLKVSSELLGMHSHFFRSLFFKANPDGNTPNLVRTDTKDVRLDNVNAEEFIELLNIIYPSESPITDANVKFILELSDQFHFSVVLKECAQFLGTKSKLPKEERLRLADSYYLAEAVEEIVKGYPKEELSMVATAGLSGRTTTAIVRRLGQK